MPQPARMPLAVIASHRLTPGHLSHMLANARLLADAGWEVRFRVDPGLAALAPDPAAMTLATPDDVRRLGARDAYVLWAPSFQALKEVLRVRRSTAARVLYVLHEPYTSFRSYREGGFSFVKTCKVYVAHLVSKLLVGLSHRVVLPSANALAAFRARYRAGRESMVPLMFDDERALVAPPPRREFVSYLGTVAEDHAFDEFVGFVTRSIDERLLEGRRFLIATRSVLAPDVTARLAPHVASGRVVIRSGVPLTTREIDTAFAESLVVWNVYRRSMQSGVLPKAYMFGTPVLISTANRSEFFTDGEHGAEVSTRYDARELADAVVRIAADFERYSAACRAAFFRHFHYRANAAAFLDAIGTA